MHIEVQVALNFVISYLYNKLPRRRVNIFGEELEKALKDKFKGHWYPEKPFKGSAFRCLKTGDPIDSVLERAAKESGVPIQDILENLPTELAVWVDPGEVSYRIGETSQVKILYSESADPHDESSADHEVTKTFNPEAQCFRPIEVVGTSLGSLRLSPKSTSPFHASSITANISNNCTSICSNQQQQQQQQLPQQQLLQQMKPQQQQLLQQQQPSGNGGVLPSCSSSAPSPTPLTSSFKGSPSPVPAFIPRSTAPLTFTTATFAQTKFGSTKLKSSSKRANRMSPTEFSNYIKQRAIQQQIHHHHHHQLGSQCSQTSSTVPISGNSTSSRSLSPGLTVVNGHGQHATVAVAAAAAATVTASDPSTYFFHQVPPAPPTYHPQFLHRNLFEGPSSHGGYLAPAAAATDIYTGAKFSSSYLEPNTIGHQYYGSINGASSPVLQNSGTALAPIGSGSMTGSPASPNTNTMQQQQQQVTDKATLVDGINNFGLSSVTPYPANNYQHLLVAN